MICSPLLRDIFPGLGHTTVAGYWSRRAASHTQRELVVAGVEGGESLAHVVLEAHLPPQQATGLHGIRTRQSGLQRRQRRGWCAATLTTR
jgi:hypothetical protein